jgi:lipopolysaccharide/colanic/teichoic acid biosynthesis glycosyltransferase
MQIKFTKKIYQSFFKRIIDILLSTIGLIVLFPVIIISWIIASLETKSNGMFIQERVGQDAVIFKLYKIKTMIDLDNLTDTNRVTRFGCFFRTYKIDELPQLMNVIIGDMSIVGPRPDISGYADMLTGSDRQILSVRPGITGPAQLRYKNEEFLLNSHSNPVEYNDSIIWPNKIKINRKYVENCSFHKDFYYICETLKRL